MKILKEVLLLVLLLVVTAGLLIAIATLFFGGDKAEAEPVETFHSSLHLIRDTATEDGATFGASLAIDANEGNWASKPAGAFHIPTMSDYGRSEGMSPGGAWLFHFAGTNTDNDTFSFNMVGWSRTNGMAQVICEGDGVLGSQDVVLYPHDASGAGTAFWADTITLDETTKWPSINTYNSGDNEVAILAVDLTGIEWIQFFVYDAAGGGTECTDVTIYGRRY